MLRVADKCIHPGQKGDSMNYTPAHTNKIEIINEIPEVLPGTISTNSTLDIPLRMASITGSRALEWIWYWPNVLPQKPLILGNVTGVRERLTNPIYGREELDRKIQKMAVNAPSIQEVWQITAKLPSLTELLLEDQHDE